MSRKLAVEMKESMREYIVILKGRDQIDFELVENDGRILVKEGSLSDHCPDWSVLYSINDNILEHLEYTVNSVMALLNSTDNYPLTLGFKTPKEVLHSEKTKSKSLKFPIPEDFFGSYPALSKKEEEEYMALAKTWVPGLLEASTRTEGFNFVGTKSNVDIYSGVMPGSKIRLIRGRTKVKASESEMRALMVSPNTDSFRRLFYMIDVHFGDGLLLHLIPRDYKHPSVPFYSIKWAVMSAPRPVWSRDVCWLEYGDIITGEDGEQIGFGVGSSIVRPECPTLENHHLIRADMICSGFIFRKAETPGYLDVTYVIQADPKGWLPTWAVNAFAWHEALNVARIRNICEGINSAIEKMTQHDRREAPVQGVHVSAGSSYDVKITVDKNDSVIKFGFVSMKYNVGFCVTNVENFTEWSSCRKYQSHEDPVEGHVRVSHGSYSLHFDNTFSWFTSKQIYYWYRVFDVDQINIQENSINHNSEHSNSI